jgi:hypothetical protein
MNNKTAGGVHWSFWVIGGVALVWNLMGAMNSIMQMNPETLANMPEPYRTIAEARPTWAAGGFAVAVFGGAIGCILLLLKNAAAFYLFIASALGVIVMMAHFYSAAGPDAAMIGMLMQLAVTAFLIWYSKHAERKGWVR